MPKVKITHNRKTCEGYATCASISEKFWNIDNENKAQIIGGERQGDYQELITEVDDKDYSILKETQEFCPTKSIKVTKI